MAASPVSDPEIMVAYKAQAQAEGSFRFRKDPLGFVSSLFVQKPSRIQGMLLVMTLALLVYAGTQRRLRQQWARQGEPVPRKSNQPTAWPPLRGGCQLREGMHRVRVTVQGQRHDLIEGLNRYRAKSSACVGKRSVGFIKFLLGRGCSMSVHTVLHVACRRVVVPAWMV
jgi:hypothetical protein